MERAKREGPSRGDLSEIRSGVLIDHPQAGLRLQNLLAQPAKYTVIDMRRIRLALFIQRPFKRLHVTKRAMRAPNPSRLAATLVAAILIVLAGYVTSSQKTQTIKIIVPSSVGGGADILARLLADRIGRTQGVTVVVENRPGASNTIGTEAAARAAPDGTTLLIATPEFVVNPHLRKLNYDPLTSFTPVCYLVRSPQLLVVNSESPYRTLDDLLDAARLKPNELTLASAGPASSTHIALETIKHSANVKMSYVPYQGSTPAVNALLGKHVTSVLASYPNVVEQVKAGKLRVLATATPTRIEQMQGVPTIAESGFKDYESEIWFGVVVPAKTPNVIVSQLAGWFTAALQAPEIKMKLETLGLFTVGLCGADFGAFIQKEYDKYGRAIRETNFPAR
jgi:tripartite-type tricarboxylate transporter receptor subunit TctC